MVLAAGAGKRLESLTDRLPKTLLPVDGDRSILELTLANFAQVGIEEVVIVTGFAAERIEDRVPEFEDEHGLRLTPLRNPKAEEWNNAYSLWCAREHFHRDVLLVNGDTVHPAVVQERLIAVARPDAVILAVDDVKDLDEEEMKVRLSADGSLEQISKGLDPAEAQGEYVGLTMIGSQTATALAGSLEATWRRDPGLYYEDGFQELADREGAVTGASIGSVAWVEVDDARDLELARAVAAGF